MGIPFVFRTPKLSPLKFIVASYGMLALKFDAQKCLYVCYICRLMSKQKKKRTKYRSWVGENANIHFAIHEMFNNIMYISCFVVSYFFFFEGMRNFGFTFSFTRSLSLAWMLTAFVSTNVWHYFFFFFFCVLMYEKIVCLWIYIYMFVYENEAYSIAYIWC